MTALVWLGVLAGGGFGAIARFAIDRAVGRRAGSAFPFGTSAVNLSGAFVLGLLTALALPHAAALIVGTGVIGAYTTFSTWMLETQRLAEERQFRYAVTNVVAPALAGLGFAALGFWIGLTV